MFEDVSEEKRGGKGGYGEATGGGCEGEERLTLDGLRKRVR